MNILSLFKYSYLLDIFKSEMLKLKLLFIETYLLTKNMLYLQESVFPNYNLNYSDPLFHSLYQRHVKPVVAFARHDVFFTDKGVFRIVFQKRGYLFIIF